MPYTLPEKLKNLTPYTPDSSSVPVRLDANESFIIPDEQLLLEISGKLRNVPLNRYPDPLSSEVCAAFAGYYGISPENITAGNGSDELISVIINSFLNKGDKILTSAPDFSMYGFYAHLAECVEISLPKSPEMTINPGEIISTARRESCRAVIFSNPCNPTSTILSRAEVREIIEGTGALVILDEAYMDFADQSLIAAAQEYDNLIVLRTCSKMMGLACGRIGFAVSNPRLTKALRAAKSPYNVNSLSAAAASVILNRHDYLQACANKIIESRNTLDRALRVFPGLKIYPSKTNFLYIGTPEAGEIFEFLKSEGILVRRFPGALRITAGNMMENEAVITAVSKYFKERESLK